VSVSGTIRSSLLTVLLLCAGAAVAQHGGGGGGMGGPPGGGGMGGMNGGMGGRMDGPPRGMGIVDRRSSSINNERMGAQRVVGLQLGLPGRWWDEKKTMKTLSLRNDQQHKMDDIFNANKGTLSNLLSNLQHEGDRLTSMTPQDLQDETKVFAAIDRFEMARADLEKEKAHILLQIRQQLDPDQLTKLDSEIASLR
jgi:Spy/CpxP family protein refolding chaperone